MQKSMSLEYEPSSEPMHIYVVSSLDNGYSQTPDPGAD